MLQHDSFECSESHTTSRGYNEHGYLIYNNILDNSLLDRVRHETKIADNSLDRWKRHNVPNILNLAFSDIIFDILSNLYAAEPLPFQTLNFDVSPAVNVHADTIHFHTIPYGWMCGVWVALEDCTIHNGPLQYYPGSHKLPVMTMEQLGLAPSSDINGLHNNLGVYSAWMDKRNTELGLIPDTLICDRGTVLIWHANLSHRSLQPDPGTTRATQVTHYYFIRDDIKYTVPAFGARCLKGDVFTLRDTYRGGCAV